MDPYLVVQIPAPMASWGGIAKGEIRPTDPLPRRSTLLGMVAAALGIRRDEDERHAALARDTELAVEVWTEGVPALDYHTIALVVPPSSRSSAVYPTRRDEVRRGKLTTLVSKRHYRNDAFYRVALWVAPDAHFRLDAIGSALEKPHFTLYLGRKSCPLVAPLCPEPVEAESILDAFERTQGDHHALADWRLGKKTGKRTQVSLHWTHLPAEAPLYRPSGVADARIDQIVTRHDDPVSRVRWEFRQRQESSVTVERKEVPDVPQ